MIFGPATHISGDAPFVKAKNPADRVIEWRTAATSASGRHLWDMPTES